MSLEFSGCHEPGCVELAEPYDEPFYLEGCGRNNKTIRIWFQKWRCLGPHHYMIEIYEEEL
jgi:hypothetical protein